MTTINALPFTKALVELLAAQLHKPVGHGSTPKKVAPGTEDDEVPTLIPLDKKDLLKGYAIVYPMWRNLSGPPFLAPDADAELVYQITLTAGRGDHLEWMKDKVFATILGRSESGEFLHPIEVDGLFNSDRSLKEDPGTGIGDDTTEPRFGFNVTPRGA